MEKSANTEFIPSLRNIQVFTFICLSMSLQDVFTALWHNFSHWSPARISMSMYAEQEQVLGHGKSNVNVKLKFNFNSIIFITSTNKVGGRQVFHPCPFVCQLVCLSELHKNYLIKYDTCTMWCSFSYPFHDLDQKINLDRQKQTLIPQSGRKFTIELTLNSKHLFLGSICHR